MYIALIFLNVFCKEVFGHKVVSISVLIIVRYTQYIFPRYVIQRAKTGTLSPKILRTSKFKDLKNKKKLKVLLIKTVK